MERPVVAAGAGSVVVVVVGNVVNKEAIDDKMGSRAARTTRGLAVLVAARLVLPVPELT